MTLPFVAIAVGLILLVWGADRFVVGAAAIAKNFGVSPLLIGLTIVGLGTTAPEILVSGAASLQGNPGLAIGNAIGSNIANIGLILGISALVMPLAVQSETLRRELPLLLGVSLFALALMVDGHLGQVDGLLLLAGLGMMLYWLFRLATKSKTTDPINAEYASELRSKLSTGKAIGWLLVGLTCLLIGSKLLVWGATQIALHFGVSDLVIGLTIVAIGTSLPELAASVTSALKNEHDIAIGNVIGSNMYNLLAVLSLPGIISPYHFDSQILTRDFPVMIGLTLALLVMSYGFRGPGRINRWEGVALLLAFCAYQFIIYQSVSTASSLT